MIGGAFYKELLMDFSTNMLIQSIPFSYLNILREALFKRAKILDIGCSDGELMNLINYDRSLVVTGVELYKPYIKKAKSTGAYKDVLLMDVTKLDFKNKTFDICFCSQVIEHIKKKDVLKMLKKMEKIAIERIVVTTINGAFEYDSLSHHDDNPLQKHLSGWSPSDFQKMGYSVHGQGLKWIYKPGGLAHIIPRLNFFWYLISFIFAPLVYYCPNLATYLIAVKDL